MTINSHLHNINCAYRIKKQVKYYFIFAIFILTSITIPSYAQLSQSGTIVQNTPWDTKRYIDIDEIQPSMKAFCLTCYAGTKIEKFPLKIISVIRGITAGHNAILVQGTDKRFIHTGPVAGCSGSPVYINGRLAGALAFGWPQSKDPLYGVTPIKEMLSIGTNIHTAKTTKNPIGHYNLAHWNFNEPIDLAKIANNSLHSQKYQNYAGTYNHLQIPLLISGLPNQTISVLNDIFTPLGLTAVPNISGNVKGPIVTHFTPGSSLVIPLVKGDIQMAVIGTATEVRGKKVFGFGHNFLGTGKVDLPLATGYVHTIVSNTTRSFKLGSTLQEVGALRADEPTGIVGYMGQKARTIPLTLRINHFNRTKQKVFHCKLAYNKMLTADLLNAAIQGAALGMGALPSEHTIYYQGTVELKNNTLIRISNISSDAGLNDVLAEASASVMLLMNNPYKKIQIKAVNLNLNIIAKGSACTISSVSILNNNVKPGEKISVSTVLQGYRAQKQQYKLTLNIPENIKPGTYQLTVCGSPSYLSYIRRFASYRMSALDLPSLIKSLKYILGIQRDKLFCLLTLPPSGLAVERDELKDLPASKAFILQNTLRTVRIQPYVPWLETNQSINRIVNSSRTVTINISK